MMAQHEKKTRQSEKSISKACSIFDAFTYRWRKNGSAAPDLTRLLFLLQGGNPVDRDINASLSLPAGCDIDSSPDGENNGLQKAY